MKKVAIVLCLMLTLSILTPVASLAESDNWNRVLIYNQGYFSNDGQGAWRAYRLVLGQTYKYKDDGGYLTLGNNKRADGSLQLGSGCSLYTYAYAIQWMIKGKSTLSNGGSILSDVIAACQQNNEWAFNGSLAGLHRYIQSLGAKPTYPSGLGGYTDLFNNGGVVIVHPPEHYALGVGLAYHNGTPYLHIIDSSCKSTLSRINYDNVFSRDFQQITSGNVNSFFPDEGWGYCGGEYYVNFYTIEPRLDSYSYLPPQGFGGGGSGYSWNTLYSENSTYKVTKAFNWRNGPSSTADVVGSASVGDTFQTESVIWNTTTNNMWVKVRGAEKYVFAGYKWDGSKWFVDNTQNQYLQFASDNASIEWPGCNVGGTHTKGNKLAVLGNINCSNNMVSIQGEFYNGASCWGSPTSKYSASGTSYYVPASELDYGLSFSTLPASNSMKLVVTVEYLYNRGQNTGSRTYEVGFIVSDGGSTQPPSDDNTTINKTYRIKSTTTWGLNVRSVPTTSNNNPIGLLNPEDTIACTKRTNYQANGYYWLYGTSSTGLTGWISENLDWIEEVSSTPATAYLDVNGWLDGVYDGGLNGFGTVDVYISGSRVADDVGDYYTSWPVGTSYEIKDVKACNGYVYNGLHDGSLSGTIGSSGTSVVLSFGRDTVSPTISNIRISNITPDGFTVNYNVSDNVGVSRVNYLAWTEQNWQDDMIGHDASLFGDNASFTVETSEHNNETGCTYYLIIYAYDAAGNRTDNDTISVFVPNPIISVSAITLNRSKLSLVVRSSEVLTATVAPSDATNKAVTWMSDNTSIVTVSSSGVITAVGAGTATITCNAADSSGVKATCTVTVEEEVIPDFVLPSALKEIGEEAFAGIDARCVVVPDGVEKIGNKAFANCQKLEQITIPASTTTIAKDAFANVPSGFTIHSTLNSYAQTFAYENGIRFVADDACTITFNADGGVSSEISRMIKKGTAIGTLPTASKSNNTLNGWYTSASDGTKVTSSTVFNSDTTIYAHWTLQTCTITFNANGGSCSTSTKTVNKGEDIGTLPTPMRTYYSFVGWYTQQNGGSVITTSTTFSQDQMLYAKWELKGFGNWSEWSTTPVTGNDNREVQTEVRSVQTGSKTKYNYRRYIYWNSSAGQWWATYAEYGSNGQWQYATSDSPFTPDGVRDGNQRYNGERRDGTPYWYFETTSSEPIYSDVTYYRYRDRLQ